MDIKNASDSTISSTENLRVNKFVLNPSIPQDLLNALKGHYRSLECVTSTNWEKIKMPQICPYILEWSHDEICEFYANRHSTMYLELQDIRFHNLRYMNTWGNNIESIECIGRIFWPNLQQICLWDNKITSIRPFRRIFAPKLTWLDLKNNQILDHESLSEFYCPKKKYTRIHVTFGAGTSCMVKIEGTDFSDLQIISRLTVENSEARKEDLNRRYCYQK